MNTRNYQMDSYETDEGFTTITSEEKEQIFPGHLQYHEEWTWLFGGNAPGYVERLRALGRKGQLKSCRFRSLCWKVFLECLPENQKDWVQKTRQSRAKYKYMQDKLATNPRTDEPALDLNVNNPLSQEEKSPWNQYFQDSELKLTIHQDVIRTFPEIDFFHTPIIQTMLVQILFCYARHFPEISYRQGMHELLAPILFVLYSDQQAFLHASEKDLLKVFPHETRKEIEELLDPAFTEHDAFYIFTHVMDIVEPWYTTGDRKHHKMEHLKLTPFSQPPETGPTSVIEVKLTKIHDQLLRKNDVDLFTRLKALEIVPPIYGIRWLRLLFGREYPLQDLLVVWDALFSNSLSFDLADYIFCAMLMTIRDCLMNGDYASCLGYLMRFPPIADIHYVINLALHLKEPLKFPRPVWLNGPLVTPNPPSPNLSYSSPEVTTEKKAKTLPSNHNSRLYMNSRPRTLTLDEGIKATSEPNTLESSPEAEVAVEKRGTHGSGAGGHSHHVRHRSDNWEHLVASPRTKKKLSSRGSPASGTLSQSLGHLDNIKGCKEMVPLAPRGANKPTESQSQVTATGASNQTIPESELRSALSQLICMREYCWHRMTLHLDHLQEGILQQNLPNEDELLLAVAGLKRIRDILKGTLTFSEEVISDEDCSQSANEDWQILDVGQNSLQEGQT